MDVLARVAQITIESEYYDGIKANENVPVSLRQNNFRLQS